MFTNCGYPTQGTGNIVKERIQRAARGEAPGQRPMLLFPEVSSLQCMLGDLYRLQFEFCFQTLYYNGPCNLQGTTTNGRYLLPFKSGAFLAGCPVQPVLLKYGKVCRLPYVLYMALCRPVYGSLRNINCPFICRERYRQHGRAFQRCGTSGSYSASLFIVSQSLRSAPSFTGSTRACILQLCSTLLA